MYRQAQDREMVNEAQGLQLILWQQVLKRLDPIGQKLFALYGLLFVYEKIIAGQLVPGPSMVLDEIRQAMRKSLDRAHLELASLGLVSSDISPAGEVDLVGLEPTTPTMPLWCAPNCATGPCYFIFYVFGSV